MARVFVNDIFSNPTGWLTKALPPKPMYFVLNRHTLGYVQPGRLHVFCPLAADVHGRDWKNGPFHLVKSDVLTPATLADFERFRVDPKGHLL